MGQTQSWLSRCFSCYSARHQGTMLCLLYFRTPIWSDQVNCTIASHSLFFSFFFVQELIEKKRGKKKKPTHTNSQPDQDSHSRPRYAQALSSPSGCGKPTASQLKPITLLALFVAYLSHSYSYSYARKPATAMKHLRSSS